MNTRKPTCRWVNHPDWSRRDTMYCGKPVDYRMVKDDDGRRVRKYDTLCALHKKIWAGEADD